MDEVKELIRSVERDVKSNERNDQFNQKIGLNSEQSLSIEKDGDSTVIKVLKNSSTLVNLRITDQGAEVLLTEDCAIRSSGDISVEAENLGLKARNKLTLESLGDADLQVKGDYSSRARIQTIKSTLGNVNIKANDDVKVRAERILLNT